MGFHADCPEFLSGFDQSLNVSTGFSENPKYEIS
jgi:hypothetical protein